ncbi:uncharacterized protein [Venturia canescens]|uniref:uncharacterized protein n=1 Tax=Venturia canescens TaxID=32260 RepID=UPI001C9C3717|nr:uncharacterized protein LOC122410822 [Venturia canescens]
MRSEEDANDETEEVVVLNAEERKNSLTSGEEGAETQSNDIVLEPEVLGLIGKRLIQERTLAPPIHNSLASRWEDVIKKGLPDEERSEILKKYSPPKNCEIIDPPKLNLEVKASLEVNIVKRDERIVETQTKIGTGLAALGRALDLVLKGDGPEKLILLECLSSTANLLADLQHDETEIRKSLILRNISPSIRETLKDTVTNEWLFGKDLEEKKPGPKLSLQDDGSKYKGERAKTNQQDTRQGIVLSEPQFIEEHSNGTTQTAIDTTTPTVGEDYPGCRDAIREAFKKKEIPEEVIDLMISSISDSTIKQYNSGIKKWWIFCQGLRINPYKDDVPKVISFLGQEYKNNASFGSLNSYRSAIALLHGPQLGEDYRIKRFFRAISKVRPAKPKYDSTWDPQIVLDHVCQWGDNEKMPLEKLGFKLVTLLALITGQRMQTLSFIDVRNIEQKDNIIEIKIPDTIKTSGKNRIQPTLIIPNFYENKNICAASALQTYITRTKRIREIETRMFISAKKPFKAVSSQTLSRWIKSTLGESGVDVDIFDAYSTRHASTSAAKRKGYADIGAQLRGVRTAGESVASTTLKIRCKPDGKIRDWLLKRVEQRIEEHQA